MRRLGPVPCLLLLACAAPSDRYQRSLRAYLLEPQSQREERIAALMAMAAEDAPRPGVRLAAAHHAARLGRPLPANLWLDAEALAFPAAAAFLAAYRGLAGLPPPSVPPAVPSGVVLVSIDERTRQSGVLAEFAATIERPLQEAGWYVVPLEITSDVLEMIGGPAAALRGRPVAPAALRGLVDHGIAACLVVEVRDFWLHEALAVEVVRFDVEYTLIDCAVGEPVWQRTASGRYERQEPIVAFPDEDETFFYPSSLGPSFGDAFAFTRALQADALATVPAPPSPADG